MNELHQISLRERIRLNLISAMDKANINQVQLAERLGISKGTVNNWTRGNNSPDVDMVPKICNVLGISIVSLYAPTKFEATETMSIRKTESITEAEIEHIKKYRVLDEHSKGVVESVLNYEYQYTIERQKTISDQDEDENIITLPLPLQGASAGTGEYADDDTAEKISVVYNGYTAKADYLMRVSGDSMEPKFYDGDLVLVREQPAVELGEIGIFVIDGDQYIKEYRGDCLHSLNPEWEDVDCTEDTFCRGKVIGVLNEDWMR